MLAACSQNITNFDYKTEKNYKSSYIVDSIKIDDPVRIESLIYGGMFITSKSDLINFKGKKSFFLRPDVFLYSSDFYLDIPMSDYSKYRYPDYGNCELIKSNINIKGLSIYEFQTSPHFFILGLINAKFFNKKHNAFDVKNYRIKEKNEQIIYYKIVYPLCK